MKKRIVFIGLIIVLLLLITACGNKSVTINFDSNGGTSCTAIKTNGSKPVKMPNDPTKENFEFDGWFWDNGVWSEPFTFNSILDKPLSESPDLTVYAKWKAKNKYTISFDSNGGSDVEPITQDYFSNVYAPVNPRRFGYAFVHWELDGTEYFFATMPLGDITLKAVWRQTSYSIIFENLQDGTNPNTFTEYDTDSETNLIAPTRIGYRGTWDITSIPRGSIGTITVTAIWIKQYTVTFETFGGTYIPSETVDVDAVIKAPSEPERIGFRFIEWYSIDGLAQTVAFPFELTKDKTIYAKWIALYTISYNSNGGTIIPSETVDDGTLIQAPADIIKPGLFRFVGWYNDIELTETVTFPFALTRNTELYAKYIGINIINVAASENFTLFLDENGDIWARGYNGFGCLGDGTNESSQIPIRIKSDKKFKSIAVGIFNSFAIDEDGGLWGWGSNIYSLLVNEDDYFESSIPILISKTIKFKTVSVNSHILAIDENGTLWAWGNNGVGQLGNGQTEKIRTPIQIMSDKKFVDVSAGDGNSLAIDEKGKLWSWGINYNNAVPMGQLAPKQVMPDKTFKAIAAAEGNNFAIEKTGELWAWGWNNGHLGDGTNTARTEPVWLRQDIKFVSISAGIGHCLAIDESGKIWAWGINNYSQLGDGTTNFKYYPVPVLPDMNFVFASAGGYCSWAIDELGGIWVWGDIGISGIGPISHISPFKFN